MLLTGCSKLNPPPAGARFAVGGAPLAADTSTFELECPAGTSPPTTVPGRVSVTEPLELRLDCEAELPGAAPNPPHPGHPFVHLAEPAGPVQIAADCLTRRVAVFTPGSSRPAIAVPNEDGTFILPNVPVRTTAADLSGNPTCLLDLNVALRGVVSCPRTIGSTIDVRLTPNAFVSLQAEWVIAPPPGRIPDNPLPLPPVGPDEDPGRPTLARCQLTSSCKTFQDVTLSCGR